MQQVPWYFRLTRYAPALAAVLFIALTVLRTFTGIGDGVAFLYVFPISLLAIARGLRGGLLGGAIGFGLFAVAVTVTTDDPNPLSWFTRVATLLAVGALLGRVTDELRNEAGRRRRQEEDEKVALEINDSLIQNMVAAKWIAEKEQHDQVADMLHAAIVESEHLLSRLFRRHSDSTRRPGPTDR